MASFYDHPETGKLHFRATSGGHGGGKTSVFDAPATKSDVNEYRREYEEYLTAKRFADATAKAAEK